MRKNDPQEIMTVVMFDGLFLWVFSHSFAETATDVPPTVAETADPMTEAEPAAVTKNWRNKK